MLAFFFVPSAAAVAHKITETPIAVNNDLLRSKSRVFIPCLIHSPEWSWQFDWRRQCVSQILEAKMQRVLLELRFNQSRIHALSDLSSCPLRDLRMMF